MVAASRNRLCFKGRPILEHWIWWVQIFSPLWSFCPTLIFIYCQHFFCRWSHLLPPLFPPLLLPLLLPLYLRAPPLILWFTLSLSPQRRLVSPLSPLLCTLLNTRTRIRKTLLLSHRTVTHSKNPHLMLIPPHATTKHLPPLLCLAVMRARRKIMRRKSTEFLMIVNLMNTWR